METLFCFIYGIAVGAWSVWWMMLAKIQRWEAEAKIANGMLDFAREQLFEIEKELRKLEMNQDKEDDADWWKKGME